MRVNNNQDKEPEGEAACSCGEEAEFRGHCSHRESSPPWAEAARPAVGTPGKGAGCPGRLVHPGPCCHLREGITPALLPCQLEPPFGEGEKEAHLRSEVPPLSCWECTGWPRGSPWTVLTVLLQPRARLRPRHLGLLTAACAVLPNSAVPMVHSKATFRLKNQEFMFMMEKLDKKTIFVS